MRRVEGLPGVQSAFASNFVPLGGGGGAASVLVEGQDRTSAARNRRSPSLRRQPHLRKTLGVALVSGRDLTDAEGITRTPVGDHQPGDGETDVA